MGRKTVVVVVVVVDATKVVEEAVVVVVGTLLVGLDAIMGMEKEQATTTTKRLNHNKLWNGL